MSALRWDGAPNREHDADAIATVCDDRWSEGSKNGGDGVLAAIFKHVGLAGGRSFWDGQGTFAEIGARDGVEAATAMLRTQFKWTGAMVDAEYSDPSAGLVQAWVTADNVHGVLASQGVPEGDALDLLVLDFGPGFHVWHSLLQKPTYKPRVVVLLVNAFVPTPSVATQ